MTKSVLDDGKMRDLARITDADIACVYGEMLGLRVDFDYDGSGQSLSGYLLEAGMVIRFMAAIGVSKLSDAKGKSCWVTHDIGKIYKIEPLHRKDGKPFDIEQWQAWVKRRMTNGVTYIEMLTGEESK